MQILQNLNEILYSPFFGIVLTIFAYQTGVSIHKKIKHALANPILIAVILIIALLTLCNIPLEAYQQGGNLMEAAVVHKDHPFLL